MGDGDSDGTVVFTITCCAASAGSWLLATGILGGFWWWLVWKGG